MISVQTTKDHLLKCKPNKNIYLVYVVEIPSREMKYSL